MTPRDRAAATLVMTRKALDDLLDAFPDDEATYQPTPAINHALWIIGHLAHTDDWFADKLDGRASRLPPNHAELFGYGSKLKSPDAYPAFKVVMAQLKAARERLLAAVRGASTEKLAEADAELGTDLLGGLFALACHESWHSGQLSTVRRSLNLPSIYEQSDHSRANKGDERGEQG